MRILSSSVTNHTFKWYDDYVIINNTHLIINNAHLINNIIVLHPVITVVILSHYICLYTPASLPVAAMVPDHLLRIPFVIQVAMVPLSEHAFTSLSPPSLVQITERFRAHPRQAHGSHWFSRVIHVVLGWFLKLA